MFGQFRGLRGIGGPVELPMGGGSPNSATQTSRRGHAARCMPCAAAHRQRKPPVYQPCRLSYAQAPNHHSGRAARNEGEIKQRDDQGSVLCFAYVYQPRGFVAHLPSHPEFIARSAQISAFTAANHSPDGIGGHAAHRWNRADETRSAAPRTEKVNRDRMPSLSKCFYNIWSLFIINN